MTGGWNNGTLRPAVLPCPALPTASSDCLFPPCFTAAALQGEHNHAKPSQTRGQSSRERPPAGGYGAGFFRNGGGYHQQQAVDLGPADAAQPDVQQEDAVAALAAMKYSPVLPGIGMLGAAPQDTPTSLLPIPASLRASSEPEDPAANGWALPPHRLHRSSGGAERAGVERDDSELSGWRCCGVCGLRLDSSLPLAAWHMQQHQQAQRSAAAVSAHVQRVTAARRSPSGLCGTHAGMNEEHRTRNSPSLAAGMGPLPAAARVRAALTLPLPPSLLPPTPCPQRMATTAS